LAGDLAGAAALTAESESVAAATGTRFPPHVRVLLAALRGEATAAPPGPDGVATCAHWAAAILFNGLGRHEEAAAAAAAAGAAVAGRLDPWFAMWALAELVEAAARAGDAALARHSLARLAEQTRPGATDWALGIEARSAALVSDGETAERLHREAIARL